MSLRNTIKSFKRPDAVKVKLSIFELLVNTSSIHGVKYIGDAQSARTTRTFWIIAFLLSLLGCAYYATQVYDKWYVTPELALKVQFNSTRTVPFPSITICPQTKIKKHLLDYNKAWTATFLQQKIENDEDRKNFEMAMQVCTTAHVDIFNKSVTSESLLNGSAIVDQMSEAQFPINETILGAKFPDAFYNENFEVHMDRVMTSDGFCMTYNLQDYSVLFKDDSGLDRDFDSYRNNRNSSWDPFSGYKSDETVQFPARIFSGSNNKIVFLLVQNLNDTDETCLGPDQGYKIYWHMPNEMPSMMHRSMIVGMSKSKTMIMKATQVRTSEELSRYQASQRRCYFEDEKYLKFFKSYTKSHCDMECLTNFTLSQCKCVKFFMPRTSDTPVCNFTNLGCADKAAERWLEEDTSYRSNSMPCSCFPSCSRIKYEVVSNIDADFNTNNTLQAFGDTGEFFQEFPTGQISRFTVEFEDFLIETQENFLGYKIQHFISDCGGLLGLFMGCSILSLVELFYHIFVSFFIRDTQAVKKEDDEKVQTPMKDNRMIVLVDDGDENSFKTD